MRMLKIFVGKLIALLRWFIKVGIIAINMMYIHIKDPG
jgi:hypothetical protein